MFEFLFRLFGPQPHTPDNLLELNGRLIELHNHLRGASNLLILNERLLNMAQDRAAWMARTNKFIHSKLNLTENIGLGYSSVESVERAWESSPEHRANILNKRLTQGGFGVSIDSKGVHWWCGLYTY